MVRQPRDVLTVQLNPSQVDVLVVGSGPTGLGAASRLHQNDVDNWLLLDQSPEAGGLACTDTTREGFLFDMGGHVIFSHYAYFDDLIDAALGAGTDAWNTLERVSYVWIKQRWVAYPFQNNIAALDNDDKIACLSGMIDAVVEGKLGAHSKPANFDQWILRTMGKGIADIFMRPYNFKVWAYPTETMHCSWLGERVAAPDVKRALTNVILNKEDAGWGPNAVFRFPKQGGTGAIWKGVARLLPQEKQMYGSVVVAINAENRHVTLSDGTLICYKSMITTMPLDISLKMCGAPIKTHDLKRSSSHIIGIGVRGKCPHGTKCWLYYPEDDCPFYRTTVFSNYAAKNCPPGDELLPTLCLGSIEDCSDTTPRRGPYWSLMFEVSESELKPVDLTQITIAGTSWPAIVRETIVGAVATKLITLSDEIVSIYHRRIEYGYPTPSLGRDSVISDGLAWLRRHRIWSRGRFGSWKYEVGNQDHSVMLGVEAVDNILHGTTEMTLNHPNSVNAQKNMDMRFFTH
jgi:protoporphyrinogen oxidase